MGQRHATTDTKEYYRRKRMREHIQRVPLEKVGPIAACCCATLAIAILNANNPEFFFDALDNAGVYGILVLFGLLPPAMAWSQRYNESNASTGAFDGVENSTCSISGGGEKAIADDDGFVTMVPGGKTVLGSIGCIALLIIGLESWEKGRMLIS